VVIDRWHVTYHVPYNETAVHEASERLTASIENDVAEACGDLMSRYAASHDASVILIRRLDFNVNLSLSAVRESARQWGEQVATAIQHTIAGDDDSVMRFSDRGAYLARFALDLAHGRAWGKWYYSEFETLRALSTSRAICEALIREPEHTPGAFVRLMELHGLYTVLEALTPGDAETVFRVWHDHTGASSQAVTRGWIGRVLDYAINLPFRASRRGHHAFHDGLWWAALAASRNRDAASDPSLLASIDALLSIRRMSSGLSIAARADVIRLLAEGDIDAAHVFAIGQPDARNTLARLAVLIDGDLHWAQQAEGALFGEQDYLRGDANPRLIPRGPAIPSPHAGIFRLGPSFTATLAPPFLAATGEAALVRHLIAMKCLGAESAAHDPAVRLFSGVEDGWENSLADLVISEDEPEDVDLSYYSAKTESIPAGTDSALSLCAYRVIQHFQRRLIGLERSSPRHVYDNILAGVGFVRDNVETVEVELPPPPLSVLLRLAGILEEEYVLRWMAAGERTVCLRQLKD
jgi:hypothetical protein